MTPAFDINAYLRAELREHRERVDFLERERHRLEKLVAALIDLLAPDRATGLLLVDVLTQAYDLNPCGKGPTPPRSRRHLIPQARLTELLKGP